MKYFIVEIIRLFFLCILLFIIWSVKMYNSVIFRLIFFLRCVRLYREKEKYYEERLVVRLLSL